MSGTDAASGIIINSAAPAPLYYNRNISLITATVARWPNFWPNNSKQVPRNIYSGLEKLVAEKLLNMYKSGRKEAL
jgi:hypothetical protein